MPEENYNVQTTQGVYNKCEFWRKQQYLQYIFQQLESWYAGNNHCPFSVSTETGTVENGYLSIICSETLNYNIIVGIHLTMLKKPLEKETEF